MSDHHHHQHPHTTQNAHTIQASVAAMTSNQLPPGLLPYHMTSFPDYKGSAFGFGVMVVEDWEVAPSAPEGEVSLLVSVDSGLD